MPSSAIHSSLKVRPDQDYRWWLLDDKQFLFNIENLARMFHELLSRDREDDRATWEPQGFGPEAYLNGTAQGPTPEDTRKDGRIRGRRR
jgi:hypothetical protein